MTIPFRPSDPLTAELVRQWEHLLAEAAVAVEEARRAVRDTCETVRQSLELCAKHAGERGPR